MELNKEMIQLHKLVAKIYAHSIKLRRPLKLEELIGISNSVYGQTGQNLDMHTLLQYIKIEEKSRA